MTAEPYTLADKTITALNHSAIRRFQSVKSALLISGFDELTIVQQCKTLYTRLKKDNHNAFLDLFAAKYLEIFGIVSRRGKADDGLDELAELYISGVLTIDRKRNNLTEKQHKAFETLYERAETQVSDLLSTPNPVTGYSYDNEVMRKKERCEESIIAAYGKSGKQAELDKALRLWSQMSGQYADAVSDDANLQALFAANVKYVRWNTQEDERVCNTCDDRGGKIYRIDRIPDKPHWRCRCWCTPVSDRRN